MISHLRHSIWRRSGEEDARPQDLKTSDSGTSYWSSLRSRVLSSTIRTLTTGGDGGTGQPNNKRWPTAGCRDVDVELGAQDQGPVVFNNRLDVPSIRSSSDNRSRSSNYGDHPAPSSRPGSAGGGGELEFDDGLSVERCVGRNSDDMDSRSEHDGGGVQWNWSDHRGTGWRI